MDFAAGLSEGLPAQDLVEFAMAFGVLAHTTYGESPVCSLEEVWVLTRQSD